MSDDLVKRLREAAYLDLYGVHCGMEREAASRIERLEAAMRGVIAVADRDCPEFREAHAALAGEKTND